MDRKNNSNISKEVDVASWLEKTGLLHENEALRILFTHDWRKSSQGKHDDLKEYLRAHPEIVREGRARAKQLAMIEDAFPFFPFPDEEDFSGEIPLGVVCPTKAQVKIKVADLVRHILVMGLTGAGKSNFVKVFLTSIAQTTNSVFWVFDPSREYRQIATVFPGTIVLRLRDFWDNPFERPSDNINHLDWLQAMGQVFEVELKFKLASQILLTETLHTLFSQRGVLDGSGDIPTCKDVLTALLEEQKNKKTPYQRDAFKPLVERMKHLINLGKYFSTSKSIPIEVLLRKNIIFEMDGCGDEIYNLIMSLLLTKAHFYRMYNPEEITHVHMNIIEEGRVPFDARRAKAIDLKEPTLAKLMTQFRKFGVGFVVLSQEPSSISSTVKCNSNTMLAFPIKDGNEQKELQQTMRLTQKQMDFFSTLEKGFAVANYDAMPPFILDVPEFPQNVASYSGEEVKAQAEDFLKPFEREEEREEMAQEGANATGPHQGGETTEEPQGGVRLGIDPNALKVIQALLENPFLNRTALNEATGFGNPKLDKALKLLVAKGLAKVEKIKASKAKPSLFWELSNKVYEMMKEKKPKGKGSFKCKLYAHLIQKRLEQDGFEAAIEGMTPEGGKQMDVLAFREDTGHIAYEVTNSFGNVIENIEKDFEAQVSKVVLVFEDKDGLAKGRKIVLESDWALEVEKVKLVLIEEFFQK